MGNIGNGYVYLVYDGVHYKIGSMIYPDQRFARLRSQAERFGRQLDVVHIIDCLNHERVERMLQYRFRHCWRIRDTQKSSRWTRETEWFDLSPDQVAEIRSIEQEEPHTFDGWEDPDQKTVTIRWVGVPSPLYYRLENLLAVRNTRVYPDGLRTKKEQTVEEALRRFLDAEEGRFGTDRVAEQE